MLTPQDIQSKEFTKAVFGGYDMTAVDDFLEAISNDYAALYKESAILKSKIKVLVEKVEEYRSTEDAMRMALLTAQKMGDDLLAESRQKSEDMVANAEKLAREKMGRFAQDIADEEKRLEAAKERTAQFVQLSKQIIGKFAAGLDELGEIKAEPVAEPVAPKPAAPAAPAAPEDDREEKIVDTAKEINASVSDMLKDDPSPSGSVDVTDEPTIMFRTKDTTVDWSDDDEPTSPRPKFDFDNLQFGANYKDNKGK